MTFRKEVAEQAAAGYRNISAYFADVRSFYEVLAVRLAAGEYGVSLASVDHQHLFSSSDSYALSDGIGTKAALNPGGCPSYIWFPTWLGSFYIDEKHGPVPEIAAWRACDDAALMAFVWIWIGMDDAYVADSGMPECWFGAVRVKAGETDSAEIIARKIWRFFRVEWTTTAELDDWLTGSFHQNGIGCDLDGLWYMRRIPLSGLSSYYLVEKQLIRPLCEKYHHLMVHGADDLGIA